MCKGSELNSSGEWDIFTTGSRVISLVRSHTTSNMASF